MKIKRFNDINESLRDKMKPKSEEELGEGRKKLLENIKRLSNDPDAMSVELYYYLENIYGNRKELLMDMLDNGLDAGDLMFTLIEDIDEAETEREKRYKLRVMDVMYKLIEKNIDKLDLDDLSL